MGWACGKNVRKRSVYRERDNWEDTDVDGRIIPKWIFKKWHGRAWTGLICLKIGTSGRRLCIW
jgi:hypothetical protein